VLLFSQKRFILKILNTPKTFFITGSSGFIGFKLSSFLLANGHKVIGLDNHNDYYDIKLKLERKKILLEFKNFYFVHGDLQDSKLLHQVLFDFSPEIIINLAAQAGVRYASENPDAYIESNVIGFYNLLMACEKFNIKNVIYASSSSVYGNSKKIPFAETLPTNKPISLYAASKKTNELFAFNHAHNFNSKLIGLRFFTVYGEFGRPDMAYFSFSRKILENEPITIFNKGNMARDMTYVSDIVNGIAGAIDYIDTMQPATSEIFNLGNENPVQLLKLLQIIEDHFKTKAEIIYKELNTEVEETFADISKSKKLIGFNPKTDIVEGMSHFFDWFDKFYK
jgi:UDP-glucuronate 4-epimerase